MAGRLAALRGDWLAVYDLRPLDVAAFLYDPRPRLHGAAVGLLALPRNEGGSVGTSVAQTIHERRDQLHSLHLGENIDRLNPAVKSFMAQA